MKRELSVLAQGEMSFWVAELKKRNPACRKLSAVYGNNDSL
jgi:hypothetical protein